MKKSFLLQSVALCLALNSFAVHAKDKKNTEKAVAVVEANSCTCATMEETHSSYAGVELGFLQTKVEVNAITGDSLNNTSSKSPKDSGVVGGLFLGHGGKVYNSFYFGGELGFNLNSLDKRENLSFARGALNNFGTKYRDETRYSFLVGPRLGYQFDNNLFYVKPSVSVNGRKITNDSPTEEHRVSKTRTKLGFYPSLGYERSFDKLNARVEVGYHMAGKVNANMPTGYKYGSKKTAASLKVGISGKF